MPAVKKNPAFAAVAKQAKTAQPRGPVWAGPCDEGPQGGVTFSLLSRFLCCPERFRKLVVEGLKERDHFRASMEYGNLWHACEEALAAKRPWEPALKAYAEKLGKQYPTEAEDVEHWYNYAKVQFPAYVDHWSKEADVKARTPLLQEYAFDVPYKLPSGFVVRLRGKFDSVDLIGTGKEAGVYVQENKSKSSIDGDLIARQLRFDLQTMIYIIALFGLGSDPNCEISDLPAPVKGARYNVVKRSTHHRGKKESQQEFNFRLADIFREAPKEFFRRWKVEVLPQDVDAFKRKCLHPLLTRLCDWWDHVTTVKDPFASDATGSCVHWQEPYGIYHPLRESGGQTALDDNLETGSKVGLDQVGNLFPELTDG